MPSKHPLNHTKMSAKPRQFWRCLKQFIPNAGYPDVSKIPAITYVVNPYNANDVFMIGNRAVRLIIQQIPFPNELCHAGSAL